MLTLERNVGPEIYAPGMESFSREATPGSTPSSSPSQAPYLSIELDRHSLPSPMSYLRYVNSINEPEVIVAPLKLDEERLPDNLRQLATALVNTPEPVRPAVVEQELLGPISLAKVALSPSLRDHARALPISEVNLASVGTVEVSGMQESFRLPTEPSLEFARAA